MSQEAELLTALNDWKTAMIGKDAEGLDKVLHAELIYSHSNAKAEGKADLLDKTKRDGGAQIIEFSNEQTKVFGDAGYVRADVDYTNRAGGLDSIAGGRPSFDESVECQSAGECSWLDVPAEVGRRLGSLRAQHPPACFR
jgi:hypothetical protein